KEPPCLCAVRLLPSNNRIEQPPAGRLTAAAIPRADTRRQTPPGPGESDSSRPGSGCKAESGAPAARCGLGDGHRRLTERVAYKPTRPRRGGGALRWCWDTGRDSVAARRRRPAAGEPTVQPPRRAARLRQARRAARLAHRLAHRHALADLVRHAVRL